MSEHVKEYGNGVVYFTFYNGQSFAEDLAQYKNLHSDLKVTAIAIDFRNKNTLKSDIRPEGLVGYIVNFEKK